MFASILAAFVIISSLMSVWSSKILWINWVQVHRDLVYMGHILVKFNGLSKEGVLYQCWLKDHSWVDNGRIDLYYFRNNIIRPINTPLILDVLSTLMFFFFPLSKSPNEEASGWGGADAFTAYVSKRKPQPVSAPVDASGMRTVAWAQQGFSHRQLGLQPIKALPCSAWASSLQQLPPSLCRASVLTILRLALTLPAGVRSDELLKSSMCLVA